MPLSSGEGQPGSGGGGGSKCVWGARGRGGGGGRCRGAVQGAGSRTRDEQACGNDVAVSYVRRLEKRACSFQMLGT